MLLRGQNPYGHPLGFGHLPYTYPPFSLMVFLPLAFFWPGLFVIAIGNTVLLAVCVWLVLRNYALGGRVPAGHAVLGATVLLAAQWLQPITSNITFGQVNVALMTLILLDFLLVPTRARGILTGVAAMIKLTPLIFVVYIVWSRQRRVLITFLITCVVCAALPFLLIPQVATDGCFTRISPAGAFPCPSPINPHGQC